MSRDVVSLSYDLLINRVFESFSLKCTYFLSENEFVLAFGCMFIICTELLPTLNLLNTRNYIIHY